MAKKLCTSCGHMEDSGKCSKMVLSPYGWLWTKQEPRNPDAIDFYPSSGFYCRHHEEVPHE